MVGAGGATVFRDAGARCASTWPTQTTCAKVRNAAVNRTVRSERGAGMIVGGVRRSWPSELRGSACYMSYADV
jgi:hypothetical protein